MHQLIQREELTSSAVVGTRVIPKKTQVAHLEEILRINSNYGWWFDTSPTGTGKTPITYAAKQRMEEAAGSPYKIVIVGLSTTVGVDSMSPWMRESRKYNIPIAAYVSYTATHGASPSSDFLPKKDGQEAVTSLVRIELKNGKYIDCLNRIDQPVEIETKKADRQKRMIWKPTFEATDAWINYCVDNHVLLVFDEAHTIKNKSQSNDAAAALIDGLIRANDIIRSAVDETASYERGNLTRGAINAFCFLTATPLDQAECALHYFRAIGATTKTQKVSSVRPGEDNAIQAIWDYCWDINQVELIKINEEAGKSALFEENSEGSYEALKLVGTQEMMKKRYSAFALEAWVRCIMATHYTSMPDTTFRQVYRGFFNITHDDDKTLVFLGINMIGGSVTTDKKGEFKYAQDIKYEREEISGSDDASRFRKWGVTTDSETTDAEKAVLIAGLDLIEGSGNQFNNYWDEQDDDDTPVKRRKRKGDGPRKMSAILRLQLGLQIVESGILRDMIRRVALNLTEDEDCKCIVAINYNASMGVLVEGLRKWNPLALGGDLVSTQAGKDASRKGFQNDPSKRVLIMTVASGNSSVDLNDQIGGHKRYLYISPSYDMTKLHQCNGRVNRINSMSYAECYLFYSKTMGHISRVLESLSKKTAIMKRVLAPEGTEKKIAELLGLPGEYPRYIEGFSRKNDVYLFEGEINGKYNTISDTGNVDTESSRKDYVNHTDWVIEHIENCEDNGDDHGFYVMSPPVGKDVVPEHNRKEYELAKIERESKRKQDVIDAAAAAEEALRQKEIRRQAIIASFGKGRR